MNNEELKYAIKRRLTGLVLLSHLEYNDSYKPIEEVGFIAFRGWMLGKLSKELVPYSNSPELKDCFLGSQDQFNQFREFVLNSKIIESYKHIHDFIDEENEERKKNE